MDAPIFCCHQNQPTMEVYPHIYPKCFFQAAPYYSLLKHYCHLERRGCVYFHYCYLTNILETSMPGMAPFPSQKRLSMWTVLFLYTVCSSCLQFFPAHPNMVMVTSISICFKEATPSQCCLQTKVEYLNGIRKQFVYSFSNSLAADA